MCPLNSTSEDRNVRLNLKLNVGKKCRKEILGLILKTGHVIGIKDTFVAVQDFKMKAALSVSS